MKRRHSSHTTNNTTHQHQSKKQEEEYRAEKSWVSQLLALLFLFVLKHFQILGLQQEVGTYQVF
mgnify:CR=1 FL=1